MRVNNSNKHLTSSAIALLLCMYAYIHTVLQVMLYSYYFALEELNNF